MIRPRGTSYMADFMIAKVRYRETFDRYEDAERWELEVRHAIKLGKPIPAAKSGRAGNLRLDTLGALFDHVERTHWRTMKAARQLAMNAKQVVDLLGRARHPKTISNIDLQDLCAQLADLGNSNSTCNRKMAAASKLLSVAYDAGIIEKKPRIPKFKEAVGRIRWITPDEEALILKTFERWGQSDLADFTIVAVDTGCRLGELERIEWDHIQPNGMLNIWQTKANLSRSVPLTARALEALRRLKERHSDDPGPFAHQNRFGALRTTWDLMQSHLDLHDVTIHVLRHTCASRLAQTPGINLQYVQKWLGHKSIVTTMRYAHLSAKTLDACKDALEAVTNRVTMTLASVAER